MSALNREIQVVMGRRGVLEELLTVGLYTGEGKAERQYGTLQVYKVTPIEGQEFENADSVFYYAEHSLPWDQMDACDRYWIRYVLDHPRPQPEPLKLTLRTEGARDFLSAARTGMIWDHPT